MAAGTLDDLLELCGRGAGGAGHVDGVILEELVLLRQLKALGQRKAPLALRSLVGNCVTFGGEPEALGLARQQPAGGDDLPAVADRLQELDSPLHVVGDQMRGVAHVLGQATLQLLHNLLPALDVLQTCEEDARSARRNVRVVRDCRRAAPRLLGSGRDLLGRMLLGSCFLLRGLLGRHLLRCGLLRGRALLLARRLRREARRRSTRERSADRRAAFLLDGLLF
mmetsp:Transcript_12018/g.48405  ORF Transcript_12018/g.48405 Transcript_12018/m.48405 type:complete len:224 (-) Transcript_12018:1128-1799(-)